MRASLGGPLPVTLRTSTPPTDATMPDVVGLSLRQATEALASAGLSCRHDRNGQSVTRQDPGAGTPVTPGMPCMVSY